MGNGSLGTCGKGLGGLHPHLSFFFHLCCSSNQSPQLKFQQVGLYHPEVGESRAVRGERPAWSPSSVDICPSTTPHCHSPPCPLAGCAGMPFLDFLTAFCQHQPTAFLLPSANFSTPNTSSSPPRPPLPLPPSLTLILGLDTPHTSCPRLQLQLQRAYIQRAW